MEETPSYIRLPTGSPSGPCSATTVPLYLSLRAKSALGDSLRVELDGVIGEVEPGPARKPSGKQQYISFNAWLHPCEYKDSAGP